MVAQAAAGWAAVGWEAVGWAVAERVVVVKAVEVMVEVAMVEVAMEAVVRVVVDWGEASVVVLKAVVTEEARAAATAEAAMAVVTEEGLVGSKRRCPPRVDAPLSESSNRLFS